MGCTDDLEKARIPNERVSLSSPEVDFRSRLPDFQDLAREPGGLATKRGSVEESCISWLSVKIRQCGEIVGVTVHNCEMGWDSVLQYAQEGKPCHRASTGTQVAEKDRNYTKKNECCLITYQRNNS